MRNDLQRVFGLVSVLAFVSSVSWSQVDITSVVVVDVDSPTVWIEPLENLPDDSDPTGWTAPDYDTSQDDGKGDPDNGSTNWEPGQHPVGYGDGDDTTVVTDDDNTFAIYTRTEFTIDDANSVVGMRFEVDYDDSFIAWINGVEVHRSPEFPDFATPTWNTQSGSHESSGAGILGPPIDWTDFISTLTDGTNVLAIGNWNTNSGSSDLTMVPRLTVDIDNTVFSKSPRGGFKEVGESHTFEAELANPVEPVSYAWTHDGVPVGPDSGTFTISSVSEADSGIYVCTITDASAKGEFVTPPAELTVVPVGALPIGPETVVVLVLGIAGLSLYALRRRRSS